MKKLILLVVCVIILIAAFSIYVLQKKSAPNPDEGGQQPGVSFPIGQPNSGGYTTATSSAQIGLATQNGQTIMVPDPTIGRPFSTLGNNRYYDLTGIQAWKSGAFDIEYGTDSSIAVTLLSEPVGSARDAAEASLKQLFPLSETQLCTLFVRVTVPIDVSDQYPGENLGLSFCPGAVVLPK